MRSCSTGNQWDLNAWNLTFFSKWDSYNFFFFKVLGYHKEHCNHPNKSLLHLFQSFFSPSLHVQKIQVNNLKYIPDFSNSKYYSEFLGRCRNQTMHIALQGWEREQLYTHRSQSASVPGGSRIFKINSQSSAPTSFVNVCQRFNIF